MDDERVSECRAWLAEVVRVDCISGLYDEENIRAAIEEIIELELGEPHPALFEEAATAARAGLAAQREVELTWEVRTAHDAFDDAIDDLEARGIIFGEALGFTMQQGWELIVERGMQRDGVRGFAFYHRQDLERALASDGLALAFGSWDGEDASPIGREIVHVLNHHGIKVHWNGSANTRLELEPFPWQKRRHTTRATGAEPAPPMPEPISEPPPATCEKCGGKGWLARGPGRGSDLCDCKRGGA